MIKLSIFLLIRVLCIGNSFSWDAVEQELVPLCDAQGVDVEVHNLYYGGCSLKQHVEFLLKDTAAYSHRVCTNAEPRIIKDTITLRQALSDGDYDVISLQQASHDSGIRSSYEPWLTMLVDTVRAYQPNAKIYWMQTWAYSRRSKHRDFPRYQSKQRVMWDSIQACTNYVLNSPSFRTEEGERLPLIPCGKAIQLGRKTVLGDTFCRDGYHLNYTYGRFTASCVWYEILTGNDVRLNQYKNAKMTRLQARITKKVAHKAITTL